MSEFQLTCSASVFFFLWAMLTFQPYVNMQGHVELFMAEHNVNEQKLNGC